MCFSLAICVLKYCNGEFILEMKPIVYYHTDDTVERMQL